MCLVQLSTFLQIFISSGKLLLLRLERRKVSPPPIVDGMPAYRNGRHN